MGGLPSRLPIRSEIQNEGSSVKLKCIHKIVALMILAAASHVAVAGLVFDWVTGKFCEPVLPQKSWCMRYWSSRIMSGHPRDQALSICKSYCGPGPSHPGMNLSLSNLGGPNANAAACNIECDRQYTLDN